MFSVKVTGQSAILALFIAVEIPQFVVLALVFASAEPPVSAGLHLSEGTPKALFSQSSLAAVPVAQEMEVQRPHGSVFVSHEAGVKSASELLPDNVEEVVCSQESFS